MGLRDELESSVTATFKERWKTRDGIKVPESNDLKLTNDAVKLDGVVLYADMSASTQLVEQKKATFAAKVYKVYLYCAARIINSAGGVITAYDGDRIMAVFIGNNKNTNATQTALKINYARLKIINPAIKKQYPKSTYKLKHVVSIASSELFVARTGVRGANDLVWVGNAANYAAKMCALSNEYSTRISEEVYKRINNNAKYDSKGKNMWESARWDYKGKTIYTSNYWRSI